MATFVLVHGAHHGGWCWDRVAPILRSAGHTVHAPSLTGSGDRAHLMPLLGDRIDAELCVQDIIAILDSYDLTDVILVGHSMGSTFVPEVGCRRPDRVRHVVCLDGALPPATVARERLVTLGEEAPDASMFDIEDPSDIAWVNSKMTPQPVGPRMPLPMRSDQRPTTYVLCTRSVFRAPLRALVDTFDSPVIVELESGHDAMITHPVETAALLMDIAAVAGA